MSVKNYLEKGIKYLFDSNYRFLINASYGMYDKMPDEKYLKRKFKCIMGYDLDLNNPKTMNEKLQWLKLHNRGWRQDNPLATIRQRQEKLLQAQTGQSTAQSEDSFS